MASLSNSTHSGVNIFNSAFDGSVRNTSSSGQNVARSSTIVSNPGAYGGAAATDSPAGGAAAEGHTGGDGHRTGSALRSYGTADERWASRCDPHTIWRECVLEGCGCPDCCSADLPPATTAQVRMANRDRSAEERRERCYFRLEECMVSAPPDSVSRRLYQNCRRFLVSRGDRGRRRLVLWLGARGGPRGGRTDGRGLRLVRSVRYSHDPPPPPLPSPNPRTLRPRSITRPPLGCRVALQPWRSKRASRYALCTTSAPNY